jgi:hypothetical protein
MIDNCDICGMAFERSKLVKIAGKLRCDFCDVEALATEEPKRDTWPSPAPTEVTP